MIKLKACNDRRICCICALLFCRLFGCIISCFRRRFFFCLGYCMYLFCCGLGCFHRCFCDCSFCGCRFYRCCLCRLFPGTGTAAAIPGLRICGKTGSAEIDGQEETNAWFVGFIDSPSSPYCVSIVVENAGGGGAVAAPLAGKIFEYMIRHP